MNNYKFKEINSSEFDEFAETHKLNSIFQSSAWAELKSNWNHYFLAVIKDDDIVAASIVLVRDIRLGFKFAYIPRGPLSDFDDFDMNSYFFKETKKFLKTKNVVLAKFDPNIKIGDITFDEKERVANTKDENVVAKLKKLGLKHNGYVLGIHDSIQPRIQLAFKIDDDIEGRIGRKTMKKVRASYKKGVTLKEDENADNLADIINFTERRHHINLRNRDYFNDMLKYFKDNATVLTAYVEGIPISSCLLVKSKDQAEILYSGYNDEYKKFNSTYPMRYEAILWAKNHGCKRFNFGGAEGTLDDGLTMFKSAFRPDIDVYIGEFDMYVNPFLGRIAAFALKNIV